MYRKLIPTLLIIGSSTVAVAQIPTLTASSLNPITGDQFVVLSSNAVISPQSGGASQVWDFSTSLLSAMPFTVDTARAEIPGWTPHGSLFPSSNVALVSITASTTSVDIYDIATTAAFSQDGVYYNSSSQYAQYTDPMDQLRYPFTYLDTFSDSYAGSVLFMGAIPASQTGRIYVQCDGYGTLKLPSFPTTVTYNNVLRVHSTQSYVDHANLFGHDTTAAFQLETYTWYMPGYHNALLTIATATGAANFNTVSYSALEDPTHESVASTPQISASLKLYPDPAQNELNVQYSTVSDVNVRIALIDMLGREIAVIADRHSQGEQHLAYNTTALPAGLYTVKLQSGTETVTKKVEIR